MRTRRDWYLALGLTVAYAVNVLLRQGHVPNAGWDGRDYLAMAQGTMEDPRSSEYAFSHSLRIGVPFLARHFPFSDLLLNFEIINLLCGIGFSVMAFMLVAAVVDRPSVLTTLTGWAVLTLNHLNPIAYAVWYPAQTDCASDALLMLLLFIVLTRRFAAPVAFAPACFLIFLGGTLVRENFPIFLVFLWAPSLGRTLVGMGAGALGSAAGFATIAYATGLDAVSGRPGLLRTVLEWQHLVPILTALVLVYGSAALFAVLTRAAGVRPIPVRAARERGYMELGFLAVLMMAFGGGPGNNERYLFWGLPVVVLGVVPHIEALIRARRYAAWTFGVLFMLVFQHGLAPIEASGEGGCGLATTLAGHGTFVGHWTQECGSAALDILAFYAQVCVAAVVVAVAEGLVHER